MKKLNNKGFSVIELAVAFSLVAIILFLLIEITVALKKSYYEVAIKSEIHIKEAIITEKIYNDFNQKLISSVVNCGINCFDISFTDSTNKRISYNVDTREFNYGNYSTIFENNIVLVKFEVEAKEFALNLENKLNSYVLVDLSLSHNHIKNQIFSIKGIYQYNKELNPINFVANPNIDPLYTTNQLLCLILDECESVTLPEGFDETDKGAWVGLASTRDLQEINETGTYTFASGTDFSKEKTGARRNLKYVIVDNIELGTTIPFEPICRSWSSFTGFFDGNNRKIYNGYVDKSGGNFGGLFSKTVGATIRNLYVEQFEVTGINTTGGLIGESDSTTISKVHINVSLIGAMNIGGLVGKCTNSSSIINSSAIGTINGTTNVGGIAGELLNTSSITKSYSNTEITATGDRVGGIVGRLLSSTVTNVYSLNNVTGVNNVGGVIGDGNSSTLQKGYATGNIFGVTNTAGIIGGTFSSTVIEDFYALNSIITRASGTATTFGRVRGTGFGNTSSNNYGNQNMNFVGIDYTPTSSLTGIDGADVAYRPTINHFQNTGNWDFTNIWEMHSNNYPIFK